MRTAVLVLLITSKAWSRRPVVPNVLKTLDVLTPKCLAIMHLTARGRFSVLQDPEHHGNSMAEI
jgi:hypothetical protein